MKSTSPFDVWMLGPLKKSSSNGIPISRWRLSFEVDQEKKDLAYANNASSRSGFVHRSDGTRGYQRQVRAELACYSHCGYRNAEWGPVSFATYAETPQHAYVTNYVEAIGAEVKASQGDPKAGGSWHKRQRKEEILKKVPNAPRPNRTGYNFWSFWWRLWRFHRVATPTHLVKLPSEICMISYTSLNISYST